MFKGQDELLRAYGNWKQEKATVLPNSGSRQPGIHLWHLQTALRKGLAVFLKSLSSLDRGAVYEVNVCCCRRHHSLPMAPVRAQRAGIFREQFQKDV